MANSYTWSIQRLECAPSLDGLTDVVKFVLWRLYATDEEQKYGAVQQGRIEVGSPSSGNFIPYSNLTEAEVIEWVKSTLGEPKINQMIATLDQQLYEMEFPQIVTPPLPWHTANT